MSLDDQIREAVERALAGARGHFESSIRSVAYDVARAAAEERNRAVLHAAEASAADMRQKAHAQLTQFRDATLKHQDELRRSADAQIHEITRTLDEVRRAAQIEAEVLRRKAQADLDAAQQRAQGEAEDARRKSHAQVEEIKRLMEQRLAEVHGRLAEAERRLVAAGHEMQAVRKAAAVEAEELIVAQLAVAATSSASAWPKRWSRSAWPRASSIRNRPGGSSTPCGRSMMPGRLARCSKFSSSGPRVKSSGLRCSCRGATG